MVREKARPLLTGLHSQPSILLIAAATDRRELQLASSFSLLLARLNVNP